MYDVAIVGASLAGATTAVHLAERGRSVVLLDRAAFPRSKPCGEGLFATGIRELRDLGVLEQLPMRPLERIRFHAGSSSAEAPLEAAGVRRSELDAAVLQSALDRGVTFCQSTTVGGLAVRDGMADALETTRGLIRARAFVAADGLHSPMRRRAGLDNGRRGDRYGVSAHVALPRELAAAIDVTFARGYELYITPMASHEANVALLMRRAQMQGFAGQLRSAFMEVLREHEEFEGATLLDAPAAAGPFPRGCSRAWKANLVLTGDAAGFFDGISGEGMSAALRMAPACARAIDGYLASGDYGTFREYECTRRAIVRNSNLLARVALAASSREWSARLTVRNLGRRPETFGRLVSVNAGSLPLSALRPRDGLALLLGL